jgi:hypothetical protein
MNKITFNIRFGLFLMAAGVLALLSSCEKEKVYEKTRLFRPVLNQELSAELNTIIVNLGKIREAKSYTIQVSRDSFLNVEYTIESDTNYVVIDSKTLKGEELLWNTLYQIKVTAHASDPKFDSKASDLGSIRTQRFPTILNIPAVTDVLDAMARVTWSVSGAPVTKIRTFAITDLKLKTPLATFDVDAVSQAKGEFIVTGLKSKTAYQIAIYSGANGEIIRGWETYTTLASNYDPSDPRVINLSTSEDANAVTNAIATATEGQIILLKKGVQYNLPTTNLTVSLTFVSAYGFGSQKAILYTTSSANINNGATINHLRFIDVELRGSDIGVTYVLNPNNTTTTNINELTFDNCVITNMRGILRIRAKVFVKNYNINNCIVHRIGGYGVLTTDTDGAGNAAVDNINLTNSTFSKINTFLVSRTTTQSIIIDGCTMSELATNDGIVFRWRGAVGTLSNVTNGIKINNTVWGHAWDEAKTGNLAVRGIYAGLEATNWTIVNTYATGDFAFTAGTAIPGFPALKYNGSASQLWVDPYNGLNFNFKDSGFAGKYDAGDPRWRQKR